MAFEFRHRRRYWGKIDIGKIGLPFNAGKAENFRLKLSSQAPKERIGKSQASLCLNPRGVIEERSIKFKGNLSNRGKQKLFGNNSSLEIGGPNNANGMYNYSTVDKIFLKKEIEKCT